jgi:hypothetical protein
MNWNEIIWETKRTEKTGFEKHKKRNEMKKPPKYSETKRKKKSRAKKRNEKIWETRRLETKKKRFANSAIFKVSKLNFWIKLTVSVIEDNEIHYFFDQCPNDRWPNDSRAIYIYGGTSNLETHIWFFLIFIMGQTLAVYRFKKFSIFPYRKKMSKLVLTGP